MGRSRFLSSRVPGTVGSTKSMNFMTDLTYLLGGVLDEGRTSCSAWLSRAPALATGCGDRSTNGGACQRRDACVEIGTGRTSIPRKGTGGVYGSHRAWSNPRAARADDGDDRCIARGIRRRAGDAVIPWVCAGERCLDTHHQ